MVENITGNFTKNHRKLFFKKTNREKYKYGKPKSFDCILKIGACIESS